MPARSNRCVELRAFPQGVPRETDFQLATKPAPATGDGEVLERNVHLSLDPFLRGVISGRFLYSGRFDRGDVMTDHTVGQIVESKHHDYAVRNKTIPRWRVPAGVYTAMAYQNACSIMASLGFRQTSLTWLFRRNVRA